MAPTSLAAKRQRPRDEPRWLRPEVGVPRVGRKGSHSRGRAACCGARPGAPGASPDQAAVWKFWGAGRIPLSWQRLSHWDAPAGLGDCSVLTGLPGPRSLASSASKTTSGRTEAGGGHCLQDSLHCLLSSMCGPSLTQTPALKH